MTTAAYYDGTLLNKGKSRYNTWNIGVGTVTITHPRFQTELTEFKKKFTFHPMTANNCQMTLPSQMNDDAAR